VRSHSTWRVVCHVHCKDVRPEVIKLARNRNWSLSRIGRQRAFTVPGDGAVDFHSLIATLHRGLSRWLVVEAEQARSSRPHTVRRDGLSTFVGVSRATSRAWGTMMSADGVRGAIAPSGGSEAASPERGEP